MNKKDLTAEGVLMHRERNIIAVRASQGDTNTVVQVRIFLIFKVDRLSDSEINNLSRRFTKLYFYDDKQI